MSTEEVSELTELQRGIIHLAAEPESPPAIEIARRLDCSASYVRKISRQYGERISRLQDIPDFSYIPLFSHPYSVFFSEDAIDQFSLQTGDPLILSGSFNGFSDTTCGKVKTFSPDIFEEEVAARLYGVYQCAGDLNRTSNSNFANIPTLEDGEANPRTNEDCIEIIQRIRQDLSESIERETPTALIGAGVLEVLHDERDPTNIFDTPFFTFEDQYFTSYVSGNYPEISNFRVAMGDIQSPTPVYFTCHGQVLSEVQESNLRQELLSQEYFKSNWNYAQPGETTIVGPTSTAVTDDIIQVNEESLEILYGVTQTVRFTDQDEEEITGLDIDRVHEAIKDANPEFESLDATRGARSTSDLPIRRDGEAISFLFDQVTLVLSPEDDRIIWHRPDEIENIETLVNAVNHMIAAQIGAKEVTPEDPLEPRRQRPDDDLWVFDTNALYHDHTENHPTNIVHTILAHPYFYATTVKIPWPVLFEFNKHADPGQGTNPQNRQGFENVATLKTLSRLGILSTEIQSPPTRINVDLTVGDMADLCILAIADSNEGVLITGDHSLENLARLTDTSAVNIRELKTISTPSEDASLDDEVLPRIGKDLHTKSEICEALQDALNYEASLVPTETSQLSSNDPEEQLRRWCSTGEVIQYYNEQESTTCYAKRADITIVPTENALSQLSEYIHDSELLSGTFRSMLNGSHRSVEADYFPFTRVLLPSETVLRNMDDSSKPSEWSTDLLTLAKCANVDYQTEMVVEDGLHMLDQLSPTGETPPTEAADGFLAPDQYLSIRLAAATDEAVLLIGSDQPGLWKFSKLLGVEAVQLD